MHIGTTNTGGLLKKFDIVASFMRARGLHLLCDCETRLTDTIEVARRARSLDLACLSVLRPPSPTSGTRVGGGVTLIVSKPVSLQLLAALQKGAVSAKVVVPGLHPIAVIAAYLPPISSKRSSWRQEIFDWVTAEYQRLQRLFSHVIVLGDFNARLGPASLRGQPRYTADATVPSSSRTAARQLQGLCHSCCLAPAHGRHPSTPGRLTAQSPSGRGGPTEVDYILVSSEWEQGREFSVPPREISRGVLHSRHMHRPISIFIRVPTHNSPPTPPAAKPQAKLYVPAYSSQKVWSEISHTTQRLLVVTPRRPGEFAISRVQRVLHHVQQLYLRRPSVSIRSTVYRRMRGRSIAPTIVLALDHVRHMWRAIRVARKLTKPGPEDEVLAAAREHAKRLQRAACSAGRREQALHTASTARDMSRLLRVDPHGHFTGSGQQVMSPEEPLVVMTERPCIPSAPGQPPALLRFSAAFSALASEHRVPPPGPLDPAWLQFIPQSALGGLCPAEVSAGAPPGYEKYVKLDAPLHWKEVYGVLFPPNKDVYPRVCHPLCILCRDYLAQWTRWSCEGPLAVPPAYLPTLHTSVAGGPDGIFPETLEYARTVDWSLRRLHRYTVSREIAEGYNEMLSSGNIPPDFATSTLTPVLKKPKPGHSVDPADPDSYRGIAVAGSLCKLLMLVLTRRLTHWAILNDIISPPQAGFLPHLSCEHHVFTLLQTIKERLRRRLPTYVLFVDFTKAYDLVHRSALWNVLATMGVPPRLLTLLRNVNDARTCRVKVNGSLSEPYASEAGVAQGDPMSCLLYVLYIESLSRFLACGSSEHGVTTAGLRLTHLLFADDLACLGESPLHLQRCLDKISAWSAAWAATVSTGKGKTEAMAFHHEAPMREMDPLSYNATEISWTPSYRYLGFHLRDDLDDSAALGRQISTLAVGVHRYFMRNVVNRAMPVGSQVQLYRTTTVSAADYLRCLLFHPAGHIKKLDSAIAKACRSLIGVPPKSSSLLVLTVSHLAPTLATTAREQERFRLQMLLHPFRSAIAPRLYRALLRLGGPARGKLINWPVYLEQQHDRVLASGAVFSEPLDFSDIYRTAHVWGRSYGYQLASQSLPQHVPSGSLRLPPTSIGSRNHLASLSFGMCLPAIALGTRYGCTPLSLVGPGCSGGLLGLTRDGRFPAYTSLLLGAECLSRWPFFEAAVPLAELDDSAGPDCGQQDPRDYEERFSPRKCPLCSATSLSVYHLLCECPDPQFVVTRRHFALSVTPLMVHIGTACLRAMESERPKSSEGYGSYLVSIADARIDSCLRGAEDKFLAYWLLCATPWPSDPLPPSFDPAMSMSIIFGATCVRHSLLRDLASVWLGWSETWVRVLAKTWLSSSANVTW